MNTQHAVTRLSERMTPSEAAIIADAINGLASSLRDNRSYAIMLGRWDTPRGTFRIDADGTGPSNGTDLYVIIRQRSVVTIMWRRAAQPTRPENFDVDIVGKVSVR